MERTPSFPEDFPNITGYTSGAYETVFRGMIASVAIWAAGNPAQAQQLAAGPVPAEFPLSLLQMVQDAIPGPGAPAALHFLTRAHAPAVANHQWPEYLRMLRQALEHRRHPDSPAPHVCRCIMEATTPV